MTVTTGDLVSLMVGAALMLVFGLGAVRACGEVPERSEPRSRAEVVHP